MDRIYNDPRCEKGGIFLEYYSQYDSPIGTLLLVSDGSALTGLWMNCAQREETCESPIFTQAKQWLDDYFRGIPREVSFPLRPSGTPFQQLVWKLLLTIPFGQTRSYGDLAKEAARLLGKERMSAQAIGQAVGANPIGILIPCHRCVGVKGQMTGYAAGIEKKVWLLRHEEEHT